MFEYVEFNTEEKMNICYEKLRKDTKRHAYTFHIVEPKELVGKYWVYYLPKRRVDMTIREKIINLIEIYNDAHGYTREIADLIDFLRAIDNEILDGANKKKQEEFVDKYLEIYGRR